MRHPVLRGDERLDDLRVEDAAAAGDLLERADELVDVGDPLLQEVPEPGGAVLQQLVGVLLLRELRQHHDADRGVVGRIGFAALIPSSVSVGGIRMSVSTASGACSSTAREQLVDDSAVATRSTSATSAAGPLSPRARGSYPPRRPRATCADRTRGIRGGRHDDPGRAGRGQRARARGRARAARLLRRHRGRRRRRGRTVAPGRRRRARPRRGRDRHQDAAVVPARGDRLRARDPPRASRHGRRGALRARRRGVRARAARRRAHAGSPTC